MKEINPNNKEEIVKMEKEKLFTIEEAAQMAGVKHGRIAYARRKNWIQNVKELEPKIRFTEEEIKKYKQFIDEKKNKCRTLDFDLTQNYKFLPTCPRVTKCFGDPTKFQSSIAFAVGDGGTVVNCNSMRQEKAYLTGNGHLQVNLQNGYQPLVHTLVGTLHCDNGKLKPKFHHINEVKTDNRAVNLLAVTDEEHGEAHRLLNSIRNAKTTEDLTAAKMRYQEFIETVQNDNKEPAREDLHVIDDLDYPGESYMFVTEKSYQKYLQTDNESDLVIKAQYFK